MKILSGTDAETDAEIYLLANRGESLPDSLTAAQKERVLRGLDAGLDVVELADNKLRFFVVADDVAEKYRERGAAVTARLNALRVGTAELRNSEELTDGAWWFSEGMALSNYRFVKHRSAHTSEKKRNTFHTLVLSNLPAEKVDELKRVVDAVFTARDWVNEPHSHQTADEFIQQIVSKAQPLGVSCEVFGKEQIVEMGMGGVLAVNKGSVDPPAFGVFTWSPEGAVNKRPIVLVGKGIVYDTGGLSLKPTPNSMDIMKCDMAGGAAVAAALLAVAANKLPMHVVVLVPATDNRPGGNAVAPGDVITMYDKTTVEVMNTDAEGRLILADALAYAKKYKPELVVDAATLTGAAMRAIGNSGIAGMGNSKAHMAAIAEAGESVYERVVDLPLWEEYAKEIESDIADLKNLGGANAGAQTAGKFLEHFTDYPWLHLDIAGPAFLDSASHYRPKGGTGYGVRLLYQFIKNYPQWQTKK